MKKILVLISFSLLLAVTTIGCGSSSPIGKVEIKPVINGSGEEIGKYGIATYNPEKITDDEILEFYNKNIKDSGLNWFTLVDKNDKTQGIVFPGCYSNFDYGTIDKDGSILKSTKTRVIEDGEIKDIN